MPRRFLKKFSTLSLSLSFPLIHPNNSRCLSLGIFLEVVRWFFFQNWNEFFRQFQFLFARVVHFVMKFKLTSSYYHHQATLVEVKNTFKHLIDSHLKLLNCQFYRLMLESVRSFFNVNYFPAKVLNAKNIAFLSSSSVSKRFSINLVWNFFQQLCFFCN